MNFKGLFLAVGLAVGLPHAGFAASYGAGIENSQWYLSGSIFECSLVHNVPGFGTAVFYHEAGESLVFHLQAPRPLARAGQAALVIEAPTWRPGARVQNLGLVNASESARAVQVDARRASAMVDGLRRGMQPTITRQGQYSGEAVRVGLSPVRFEKAYQDYLNCLSGLLPHNFRQLERSVLGFDSGDAFLSEAVEKRLDDIILYVKADPSVTGVVVDGHSDSYGRRITNRQLSKDRAEIVARYLVDSGLNEDMITVRFHGDRYPVADNKTEANRARNRRATVRLERKDPYQTASALEANPAAPY